MRRDLFDSSADNPWRWDDLTIAAIAVGVILATAVGWI